MNSARLKLQIAGKRRAVDPGSRLVPMINIIFLLLIFFLVAGQIQAQHGLELQAPAASIKAEPRPMPAHIQLDRNLMLYLAREPISLDELRLQADSLKPASGDALVLEVDRDVMAGDLDPLLELLREAGIDNIRLLIQVRADS